MLLNSKTGWWFQIFFMFTNLTTIFQRGGNHQLVDVGLGVFCWAFVFGEIDKLSDANKIPNKNLDSEPPLKVRKRKFIRFYFRC